jgi:hypothetical protein
MGTPFATIGRAFLDSGATQTDELIEKGAKGSFFQDTRFNPKKKRPLVEPEAKVDNSQPPIEPPDSNIAPGRQEPDPIIKDAEKIVKPVEVVKPRSNVQEGRNFNLINTTDSDELLQVIDNMGSINDNFADARGGVVSHKQTIADSSKTELEQIVGFKLGDGVTPGRITGARIALQQSADNLKTMATKVLNGDASTADKLSFRQAVSTHVGIQQGVAGMAAESGRSLNAWRIPVGINSGSKTAIFRTQLQEAFERSGGDDTVRKLAEMIDSAEDLSAVTKAASKAHSATSGDMILEVWINGLLSSPATHVVNTTSNALVATWAIPERLLASGISKLLRSEQGVQTQEALGQLYGIVYGARDGFRMFWKALKTGEPTDPALKLEAKQYRSVTANNVNELIKRNNLSPMDTEGYLAKGVDLLGNAARIPGRFLGAEDEFFKAIGYRMELNALAFRKATSEGLEGDELSKRIVSLIDNPTEELHLAASDIARVQTFTNPLGKNGRLIQQLANSHPALKLILPFVRTPVNIVKYVGMRSPIAPLAKSFRADVAAGGARRDMALAKMSLGSLTMVSAIPFAFDGTITGSGPKNKSQRNAMRRQGWQPYSLKVGDKYYSFSRLDPIGMFLGLVADVSEVMKYAEDEDRTAIATAITIATAKNVTSKTYLRGLSDTFNVLSDPDRYAESYFRRMGATFTPMTSLVAQAERTIDPTLRATRDLLEQIMARTPGLSDKLPPRRNLWGEPIVLEGGLGWDFVSPIYTSTEKFDIVDQQIAEHETSVSMPRRIIGSGNFSIEMNGEEYDRYIVLAGKEAETKYHGDGKKYGLRNYLKKVMRSDMYISATDGPDGGKSTIIKSVVNSFRDLARYQLLKEFPALNEEWKYQQTLKQEARTGVKF